ncbi:hypothetical protein FXW78_23835 [Rhodococcus opacus]|nr:hypothetical protein [Rhodococcus opacus]
MRARTAAEFERELAMLACVRDRLRASEGNDFRIPTTAVDQVLEASSTWLGPGLDPGVWGRERGPVGVASFRLWQRHR